MNQDIKNHINEALKKGVRLDGRKKDEYRKLEIEVGVIATAEGSARVKCGDTEIIAGIKLSTGTPYPDSPDSGVMMVGTELLPMANPEFESGPPRIESIETARVIDRGIRESKTIDTKKLCIEKGELVWMVMVDVLPLNHDGNLIDLGGLAALAALKNAKMVELKDGKPLFGKRTKENLPVSCMPIPVTVLKIGDNLIVDPTHEEEKAVDARLTVSVLEDNTICAMQKGGDSPLSEKDINDMVDLAIKKSQELRKILNEALAK
ncbi:MAG: exosome complex protein Rrp42 [Nanoarchaeota archaeon]|nr:exosome complex protein Rrp42 [Nanoarchaeota archaeon]MBU1322329.1 exosome complex protein Rrp42 [Nanoarchaeota archaeon]MBU1597797.1 exosome complex protein Rrp42 [Nanoarchaeota archaeon]MBU2441028.1 exosome complex protein Rrp42 [Nanoarchaeota archaeon]